MQQRKSSIVSGRPSGTDGYDYSYRMVVDPRYTKVAQGKSRLYLLIIAQAISQVVGVVGVLWACLLASLERGHNGAILSIVIGSISLMIGELGRRKSHANLLRLYIAASSIATAFAVGRVVSGDLLFEVALDWSSSVLAKLEMVEVCRVLLGVPVQILAVITSVSLVRNMSPKRVS